MFFPQGTGRQRLSGINSSPLISWPVCCLVVSQPVLRVVRTSCHWIKELLWIIHSLTFLFLFGCLGFTVHHNLFYNTIGDTWVYHQQTLDTVSLTVSEFGCTPLPQSSVAIGNLWRKIIGVKVICISRWHGRYAERHVVCLARGQTSHSHIHIHKRNCKYRRTAFWLAQCFQKNRKHHVTLQHIVTEKGELFVLGESCSKMRFFFFLKADTKTWLANNSVVNLRSELCSMNWFTFPILLELWFHSKLVW